MSWPAIDVNEGEGKHEEGIHPSIYITARRRSLIHQEKHPPASRTINPPCTTHTHTHTHTHSMPVRYKGKLYSDEAWCLLEQQLGPGWWRYDDDDDDDDENWRKLEEEMKRTQRRRMTS